MHEVGSPHEGLRDSVALPDVSQGRQQLSWQPGEREFP